ncbi:hypothetical protein COV15_00755 [Candidatus Woesearchaeota archaeon CG10_big_fil_rev_8_21_14_0_10_34_12]|nr:MAG: hypothetical protein COV15_00755 [Candidatus Woesearchaeota archaeon CG10_big_fil_rev_8_21_14_0_10_34_12]
MFGRKKEDKIELPMLPELPELHSLNIPKPPVNQNPPLPQLPPSNSLKLPELPSQETKKLPELPSLKLPEIRPMAEELKFIPSKPSEIKQMALAQPPITSPPEKKQIFVKIEKFQEAMNFLNEIKRKTEAIDHSMRKIKETKLREENELKDIEEEMEKIKSMIDSIDKKVFSNLE